MLIHLQPANQPAQGTDNGRLCQRLMLLHYDGAQCRNHILKHVKEQWLYKYLLCVDRFNNKRVGREVSFRTVTGFLFLLFNLQEHLWQIGDPEPSYVMRPICTKCLLDPQVVSCANFPFNSLSENHTGKGRGI